MNDKQFPMKGECAEQSSTEECIEQHQPKSLSNSHSRRNFLRHVGVTGAATIAAGAVGAVGIQPLLGTAGSAALAAPGANQPDQGHGDDHERGENDRASECLKLRKDAPQAGFRSPPPNLQHPTNHDEALYANKAGSYAKGLPHNSDGTVVLSAFQAMVKALNSEKPAHFNQIPLGGNRKLTNPQAGVAFDME